MNYKEATEYIEAIPLFGVKVEGRNKSGNENLSYILDLLDAPHKKCKSIHIAGTNGKGSTARFVADILFSMGYTVGIFTSPHLIRINERIAILKKSNEQECIYEDISDDAFAEYITKVKDTVDMAVSEGGMPLSYFEVLFVAATMYFADVKPDFVIYETGLGGRLDATNLLAPVITAITSIGLDHTRYLGNTIREIAFEKAGIIKQGIPVVYNTGDMEADIVIETRAEMLESKAINVANSKYIINEITNKSIAFSIYNSYYKYNNVVLNSGAALYQIQNAMTAIEVCNMLFEHKPIDEDVIQRAMDMFSWRGRMEMIHPNVCLDGAHNTDAIASFIESVKECFAGCGIRLLFAVAGDKDYEPMIKQLSENLPLKSVFVTSIDSNRGISAEFIAGLFKMYNKKTEDKDKNVKIEFDDNIQSAFLQSFEDVKGTEDVLFCIGSLYLVGSIEEIAMEANLND